MTNIETTHCYVTEFGSDAPYRIGVEYVTIDGVHHMVRRPASSSARIISHAPSHWRVIYQGSLTPEVSSLRESGPWLPLPDEGEVWGEPIDYHEYAHYDVIGYGPDPLAPDGPWAPQTYGQALALDAITRAEQALARALRDAVHCKALPPDLAVPAQGWEARQLAATTADRQVT